MRTINDVSVIDATKPAKITITPLDVKRGEWMMGVTVCAPVFFFAKRGSNNWPLPEISFS